jgi:ribulose-5-phosphate 4-epimerase/fuculose-1-phosphate aldolase
MSTNEALGVTPLQGKVAPEEWAVRVDLAACYRLVAQFGWEDLVYTHITARVPGSQDEFLINPYGVFFDEITASSLVKIDQHGNKLEDSPFPVNPAGFIIHSAIHAARHDARFVLHTHTLNGVAVSAQHGGLLPLSQHSVSVLASLGYHDFEGPALDTDEKPRLVADLGPHTHLILRNHGLLTVGETAADAFVAMYYLETSCAIQVRAQAGGGELVHVPKEIVERAYGQIMQASGGRRRSRGELVWPGLLRRLDRVDPSYRT